MMKDLYQHFSHEDREFIDRSLELLQRVQDTYAFETTPFLNPHQVSILKNIGKQYDVQVFASSDYFPSELARVLVAPSYYQLNMDDFELSLLEISYASKFYKISHSQIMGTLLNQLGIERKLFGDILVDEERAQIMINQQFLLLFQDGLKKIGRIPVSLEERPFTDRIISKIDFREREILVSSFRLDALLSSALKLSRKQAGQLIEKKSVQVNYHPIEKLDYLVAVGDLISVRKFGRLKIVKENGQTKRDKIKLTIQLLLSK